MELFLHPPDDPSRHRPDRRGRLSSVGHAAAFRALARVSKRAGIRFMVVGGTFRDVVIRAASTRDIDVVLVDCASLPTDSMREAGFRRVGGSAHAWRHTGNGRVVDLEVAAIASSTETAGPFSIAFLNATTTRIEGVRVTVPRVEDYVILKLLAAAADRRRTARDLADVQYALEAFHDRRSLSVAAIRGRLRDVYGITGTQLKDLVAMLRQVPREPSPPSSLPRKGRGTTR